jgi:cell division septation protein DedD
MGTAVPGTSTFPDPDSVVTTAWDPNRTGTPPKYDLLSRYLQLDVNLMNGRSFFRNFTGHPTCNASSWEKVFDLETKAPPVLDAAFFEDGKLYIFASQPFTDGRADGAAFLNYYDNQQYTSNAGKQCIYPISPYVFKQVKGCRDVWRFQIPWSIAKECRWNQTNEDAWLVYRGQVIIHNQEFTSTEEWRIIVSVLRVKLRFQRYVTVSSELQNITNPNIQKAAITRQIVAIELGAPALVEIGTLLFWPFKLYTFQFGVIPSKVETFVASNDNCTSRYGDDCRQYWRTSLNLKRGTCTLDGTYAFNFTVGCGECCLTNCTLDTTDSRVFNVEFKLQSENFCAEIVVDVAIVGNIRSYENATFVGSRAVFAVGKRAYYWIKINSELNPKNSSGQADPDVYDHNSASTIIKFAKVELVYVDIKLITNGNGTLVRVWDNKKAVIWSQTPQQIDYKTLCQVETVPSQTFNSVGFSFVWSREIAPVPRNQRLVFQIIASVQGTYTQTGQAGKRFLMQTGGDDKTSFTETSDIDDPEATTVTTPDTTPTTSATSATSATSTPATTTTANPATTTTANPNPTTTANPATTTTDGSGLIFASIMTIILALFI